MSSLLNRELVFLILQYFNEEGLQAAARMLEQDSGFYFNMNFFEELILNGKWDEAEKYLSGFTKLGDDKYSNKIYFDIRKQKFLEALDKNDRAKALEILINDLKVFASENEELYTEMARLLTFNDIREHDSLSTYKDAESARKLIMLELKTIIEASPVFCDKLEFPAVKCQRLRRLINQALNWQHINCRHSQPDPVINTLFEDHVCLSLEDYLSTSTSNNPLDSSMPAPVTCANLKSTSTVTDSEIFCVPFCFDNPRNQDGPEDANVKSEKSSSDEETSTVTYQGDLPKSPSKDDTSDADFPETVARIFNVGSSPTSMDFHPVQLTLLLVGTRTGDIGLWEVSSGKNLFSRSFQVWGIGECSSKFKATLVKDPCVSVNRITWNPEGSLFGVAYSKHMVQVYSFHGLDDAEHHLEIEAHVGGVNDLAFSAPVDKQLVITCGDDKNVKAWDVNTGVIMYIFKGHGSPVYSVYPQSKENIHFIFSISVDGNIKAWLYNDTGARVDYVAPGLGCTSIAYSADDKRLFTCGTSKTGESFLVEWNECEGAIKRTYDGLQKNSLDVVKFDVMKNQFLAAGDEHVIKIWDMDKVELLETVDAEGGLPANPHIRFNKDGSLLAVSANENKIKILASESGLELLLHMPLPMYSTVACAGAAAESPKNEGLTSTETRENEYTQEADLELFEINNPLQCCTLWLPSSVKSEKISGLAYNNAGNAILALASNATHLLWKWRVDDINSSGKATTEVSPQLWQPKSCSGPMTNDLMDTSQEGTLSCFSLTKNDSYLMSTSGGKVSLFNVLTFKTLVSIMPPPPATTSIAFLPQDNNIVALGREDSTITIYNVRSAKVIAKLVGHCGRVASLAFSKALNMLFSSGADVQIMAWNVEGWKECGRSFLQILEKNGISAFTDTHIQMHPDQMQLLAVHQNCVELYDAKTLDCMKKWVRVDPAPLISRATFSCDALMVYACFVDGTVSIFDAKNLELRCRITSIAYLPPSSSFDVYPVDIAAHPQKPNQFAVGLTNGSVVVFEPLKTTGKWIESLKGEE
ncbi:topless-related protein 1-like [Euphorbia lathyris]|uniref:topless-related protein 1-like n=1 Tax=Euphorbia lathyris TaxID=212925 RepID=UPI003313FD1D